MIDYSSCIRSLYPAAIIGVDFTLINHGTGICIEAWDAAKLGPQPAIAQLETAWPQTKAALILSAIRVERNARLAATDFMAMPDYPNAPAGLAAYRQALRDFPAAIAPTALAWPLDVNALNWPQL